MGIFDRFRKTVAPPEPQPVQETKIQADPEIETKSGWDTVNPGGALLWGGLFPGSTGTPLTWLSSLQSAAVYACVKVLSEDLAKMPVVVKEVLPTGGCKPAPAHRVAKLLRKPNRWMNPFEFWAFCVISQQLRGNCYIFVKRNGRGEPVSLLPLSPDRVTVSIDDQGDLLYTVSHPLFAKGETLRLPSEDVIHVRNLTLGDGIVGMTPIAFAGDSIGLGLAQQRHAALLFGQGTVLQGVLSVPGKLSKEAGTRMAQSWNAAHQGGVNAHKIAVLEEDTKFIPISMSAADAQLLESRKFSNEEIARIFRVPPHKIGIMDNENHSNINSQEQSYLDDSLVPMARRFEEAMEDLLLFDGERGRFEIKFDFSKLLRADIETRFAAYQVGLQNGFLTQNEVRIQEGLEPKDDPEADKLHFPLNQADPKNTPPKKPAAKPKPKKAAKAAEPEPEKE